jgi:1,4-dihydroxy-2-naphthoate octaprenyltransferase
MFFPPWKIWLLAIRPKTLPAAIAPVLMGTAMAFGDGVAHWPSAFWALFGALTIQIGTNFANDYFDFKKGVDQSDRIGPTRVTQAGLIKPGVVMTAFIVSFIFSGIACYYLTLRGGWPILLIGISGILSGILYTAGRFSLGSLGLGELFVFVFFGPVAVGGTYYVQSLEINPAVILAGVAPGFLSMAILIVNNLRDIQHDQRAGKKTLAVRWGREFAQQLFLFAVLAGGLTPVLIYTITRDYLFSLTAVAVVFLAIPTIQDVLTTSDGPSLNNALASTGKLLLVYSILFSLGWIL